MKILCYGDSNTYGYDGTDVFGGRFPEDARWPELLGRMLGCDSVNLGLNGRRVPRFQRTIEADLTLLKRSGDGLIIVMLGTNDLLAEAGGRCRLPVGLGEHRDVTPLLGIVVQLLNQFLEKGIIDIVQGLLNGKGHRGVVDVL